MFPVVVPGLFPACSQSIPLSFIVFPVFRVFRVRYMAWGWCNTLLRHRNIGNNGNKAVSTMSCSGRHQEQIGNRSGNTVRFGRSAGRPNGVPLGTASQRGGEGRSAGRVPRPDAQARLDPFHEHSGPVWATGATACRNDPWLPSATPANIGNSFS